MALEDEKTLYGLRAIQNVLFFFCLCMFSELRTCLHNRHVAFVGDSRTRGLYYHLVHGLSLNVVKDEGKAVSVFVYSGNNVTRTLTFFDVK